MIGFPGSAILFAQLGVGAAQVIKSCLARRDPTSLLRAAASPLRRELLLKHPRKFSWRAEEHAA